jgi:hypothetical protein
MNFHEFMQKYSERFFDAVQGYSEWAASQAKNQSDLLLLTLGPIGLLGLLVWLLPKWLGLVVSLVLLAPMLYLAFVAIKHYRDSK